MRSFRRLAALSVVFGAYAFGPAFAQPGPSLWEHNGSLMRLEEKGKKRSIVYEQPRSSLQAAGVKPGTVLFEGEEKADGRFAGYAKLFRKGCDPIDYFVEGAHSKEKGEILLQGQAPIYSGESCKITGYSDDGGASSLLFTARGGGDRYVARAEDATAENREDRPSYLPPSSATQAEPYDGATGRRPEENERRRAYSDEPAWERGYGRRDDIEREYAQRRERYRSERHYDGYYYSDPFYADEEEEDYYYPYGEYDDEPAYVPYQPRWRRY